MILLHIAIQYSQCHLLKRLFFPIVYSCFLCHGLIDHISMDHQGHMLRGASYVGCVSPPIVNDYYGCAGRQGSSWPGWLPDPVLCGGCWPLEGGSQSLGKGWDCRVDPWLVPAYWWVGLGCCRTSYLVWRCSRTGADQMVGG